VDQAREMVAPLDGFVVLEAKLWSGVHLDALRQLRAQETGRAPEALQGVRHLLLGEQREEDLGVRKVRRDVDRRDGQHADARVAQLPGDEVREFALDQVAQFLRAARGPPGGALHNVLATSSTSKTSNWSFSFTSLKFLSDMPHSKPALTSRTSSSKR